jgi:hypothetical protein
MAPASNKRIFILEVEGKVKKISAESSRFIQDKKNRR